MHMLCICSGQENKNNKKFEGKKKKDFAKLIKNVNIIAVVLGLIKSTRERMKRLEREKMKEHNFCTIWIFQLKPHIINIGS